MHIVCVGRGRREKGRGKEYNFMKKRLGGLMNILAIGFANNTKSIYISLDFWADTERHSL